MPGILKKILGLILLLASVGLATCQSLVQTITADSNDVVITSHDSGQE